MVDSDYSDLTSEKRLWELVSSIRKMDRLWIYKWRVIELMTGAVTSFAAWFHSSASIADLGSLAREWLSVGFNFASQLLSIMLAAFAILVAVLSSSIAAPLARDRDKHSGLRRVKYNALAFIRMFVEYLKYIAFYLLCTFLLPPGVLRLAL